MVRIKALRAGRAAGLLVAAATLTVLSAVPVSAGADDGDGTATTLVASTDAPASPEDETADASSGQTDDVTGQPAQSDEPIADEPIADEPITDEPITDEPIAGEPAATGGEPDATTPDPTAPQPSDGAVEGADGDNDGTPSSPSDATDATAAGTTAATTAASTSVEQDVEVTDVQVAVANTGRNVAIGTGAATASAGEVSITTGSASAVGNAEQTEITQQAITTLTGEASAEIVQISIVVNIGGAYASTGSNAATSTAGSGGTSSTSTGSAVAVANDAETYVTQAGSASAAGGQTDTVDQRVVTMQIGVATSDTGNNTIVATVSNGSAATVASGSASAVGNDSETQVEQIAQAVGSGSAELTIEQWATIINLGVALANTGANQIGDMVTAVMAGPDTAVLDDLFAILLPALLVDAGTAEAGGSGGTGTIASGDAVAIGNRSHTEVQQVALAVASGDGRADIRQDVVVVNAGAATANSGGNRTGAGLPSSTPELDDEATAVVAELSAFVAGLLAQIAAWADGTTTEVESGSLQTRFGDWLIDIGGDLSASVGEATTAGGVTARTRQLSAVFNLGVAIADTGNNVAVAIADPAAAAGAVAPGAGSEGTAIAAIGLAPGMVAIVTGDASARNSAVIIVCQRADMADHPCLAPEEPAEEPSGGSPSGGVEDDRGGAVGGSVVDRLAALARPDTATPEESRGAVLAAAPLDSSAAVAGRTLPATGGDPLPLVAFGGAAMLCGMVLVLVSRRRPV